MYGEPEVSARLSNVFRRVGFEISKGRVAKKVSTDAHRSPRALRVLFVDGSETVLVVDDESGIRDLVRKALETHGYRVLSAAHGVEALSIVGGNCWIKRQGVPRRIARR